MNAEEGNMEIYAIRDIDSNEEITTAYSNILEPTQDRQQHLLDNCRLKFSRASCLLNEVTPLP